MQEDNSSDTNENRIRLKRRSLKGRPKLCPRCLSPMHLSNSLSGWLIPEEYICDNCGYHGHVAFESSEENKADNNEVEKEAAEKKN